MNLKKNSDKVILVGGGRSVLEGINSGLWQKIKESDADVWSLNYAFNFMDFTPHSQLWVDTTFFKNNINKLRDLYHSGTQLMAKKAELYNKQFPITTIKTFRSPVEEAKHPDGVFIGVLGLTGTFALSLACKQEYEEIYLLGYDYGTPSLDIVNTHFYQEKVPVLDIKSSGVGRPTIYLDRSNKVKSSVTDYNFFKKYADKIFNVSTISNISNFDIITYTVFFDMIKNNS